jgi:glycogen synthase
MRILFTTDMMGGVWRYTVTLVRELVERGHTCAVAVIGQPTDDQVAELPAGVEVMSRDLRLEWMRDATADLEAGTEWVSSLALRWGADLVHLNHFAYAVGDFGVPVMIVAHTDVRSWYVDVRGVEAPAGWDGYTMIVRAGLQAADAVVAPTAYQSGRLAQHYGRTAARVIHNGVRPPPERPNRKPASERPLVLVAGRAWDEAKGIALLDEAMELLGADAPAVHLVGPTEGPLGGRAVVHRLVTHGEVPGAEMAAFYDNAGVYVGPSHYEPFGLTPLEAAAHGSALLLSGIGSFRELWYGAATFFEPGSARDLGVRLLNLLEDPATIDAQATKARERARTRYTAARMTDEYEALYRRLTGASAESTADAAAVVWGPQRTG